MRVEVDYDLCESNGLCEAAAPEVFRLDDDENLHILMPEPRPDLEEAARVAVNSCPKQALRLVE